MDKLLLETNDSLLLEDGFFVLLEGVEGGSSSRSYAFGRSVVSARAKHGQARVLANRILI